MPDELREQVRRAVDVVLADVSHGQVHNVFLRVEERLGEGDLHQVRMETLEYWSNLVRVGAVASAPMQPGHPNFVVTSRGRQLLSRGVESPHDRDRYLRTLGGATPLDAVVAGYIAEAVDAWKAGLHRASAVMTGVWRNDQGLSVTTGSANRSLNAHDAWVMPCSEE